MIHINVIKDFHAMPYGRFKTAETRYESCSGECLRALIVKTLRGSQNLTVDLTGFNRYGRSFLDEAFGGLISKEGFLKPDIEKRLVIVHDDSGSVIMLIHSLMNNAEVHIKGEVKNV